MAVQQLPGYKPLCYIKGTLYLYRKGYIYRLVENQPEKVIQVYSSTAKRVPASVGETISNGA